MKTLIAALSCSMFLIGCGVPVEDGAEDVAVLEEALTVSGFCEVVSGKLDGYCVAPQGGSACYPGSRAPVAACAKGTLASSTGAACKSGSITYGYAVTKACSF